MKRGVQKKKKKKKVSGNRRGCEMIFRPCTHFCSSVICS
jgi:hypothetical protein